MGDEDFIGLVGANPRRRLLRAAQVSLEWFGLARLYAHVSRARGAVALMYHSVPAEAPPLYLDPRSAVPRQAFESQMGYLHRHRRVVPYSSLVETIRAGKTPPAGTVALTFDDAYRDFLEVAAPILARRRIPAILFVPTGSIGRAEALWLDRLYAWFRTARARLLRLPKPMDAEQWDLTQPVQKAAVYAVLCERLSRILPSDRERLLYIIRERLEPEQDCPRLIMNWDELRELARRYPDIEIGSHGVEHVDLTMLKEPALISYEFRRSAVDLERELGKRPRHFAFPYNRANVLTRAFAREHGYESAAAAGIEPLITRESDAYNIPRLEAVDSLALLRFQTSGAYPALSRAILRRS